MQRLIKGLLGLFALLVLVSLSSNGVLAQTGTTSLRGTITDSKGASVPNAKVTITSESIGVTLSTTTDRDGAYAFQEIRPATYTLTVEASGFATLKQTQLVLLVATPRTDDIKLELATVATTVEVVSSAETINTNDATIGNAFNQSQIAALPFEGRDPVSILSLQPGVVTMAAKDQVDTDADSRGGAVNGARSDQSNVTLDGIDNNDQTKGYAFTGALRATLDSIEEFRVTTTNAGAEQGRSSGAQVSLVTKSGTNDWHGTAYEYNRPTNMVANDYFNKLAQEQNGESNTPPRLLRNTFGGSFGGPVKKDRLFFFLAYEGQRTRESQQVTRTVPSASLRDGVVLYPCADTTDSRCGGGTVQGLNTSHNVPAGFYGVGPSQILSMDDTVNCNLNSTCPWGGGVDPNTIATLNQYPLPNTDQVGDGYNYRGYTFSASTPNKLDTYVARFDYNVNQSGTQRLFARFGLQNDHATGAPQFPGQDPATVDTNNSKGAIVGYTWTISPTKVNSFHYGFIRQGIGNNGIANAPNDQFVTLRGLNLPVSSSRTTNVIVPLHNFTDDFSWTKGHHTIQVGANYRWLNDIRQSNAASYSDALTNAGFLVTTGFAGNNTFFDPGCDPSVFSGCTWNYPAVDSGFANSYDFPMMALTGIITEVDATYQRDKNGNTLPVGSLINRHYRWNEFETYLQDSWRIKSNLTINYGVRYSLLQAPYEINGNQVAPSIPLDSFFRQRIADMDQGVTYNPNFSLSLAGPANGKAGYWNLDPKDIAPRFSLAWSPGYKDGFLKSLFGGPGKSSIRLGAGVYYDHFGPGIVNTFDRNGSFGLTTTISDAPGTVGVSDAPRYTGINDIPASITPPGPTGPFPVTPPGAYDLGGFAIYWGLDNNLKTPYSYAFDLSFSREIGGGFTFEAAYVGRLGRRLLQERDLAQPLNLKDPKTGLTYYQALTALAKIYRTGVPTQNFDPASVSPQVAQFWADIMQPLQPGGAYQIGPNSPNGSCGSVNSTTIPVVAAYDLFCSGSLNETTPLFLWDLYGIPDANDPNTAYYPSNGNLTFYQSQFASLYAWTSGGRSNYNAGQFMIRHHMSHGLQWDLNYTYSKSIDMTSDAERVSLFEGYGFGGGQIINAFDPGQMRGVSDYDMTHQINSNWVYELPFGKGRKWGSGWGRGLDAFLGGWAVSGLYRWSSGLPFSIQNGFDFPTNWELNGLAVLNGQAPKTGVYNNCTSSYCNPNAFADINAAVNSFDYPFPGESGSRNVLRGPGYFDIDASLRKTFSLSERVRLGFAWEVYNVTNSVRFDAANAFPEIDVASSFGNYSNTLTKNRRMEFSLRLSF